MLPQDPTEPRRIRVSHAERDEILSLLENAHAKGELDIVEFGQRQDIALNAKFFDDFIPAISDLKAGQDLLRLRLGRASSPYGLVNHDDERHRSVTILGGKRTTIAPGVRHIELYSILGGDSLDLSAAMGPGVTIEVTGQSILGGATIKLPPGVRIVDESSSILGENSIRRGASGDGSQGTLILRNFSLLGGHRIKLG